MAAIKIESIGEKKYGTANMYILPERNYSSNPDQLFLNKSHLSARSKSAGRNK